MAHAQQRNTRSHVDFQVGDACALSFADRSFDRVLCLLVLHFVPDPARAVAEMRRVARRVAVVAVAVWDVRGAPRGAPSASRSARPRGRHHPAGAAPAAPQLTAAPEPPPRSPLRRGSAG